MRVRLGLAALFLCLAAAHDAHALPAFARRYQTACTTCHTQFPNLNPFGEAFRRNGYQFPAGADLEEIKQPPLTLVSEARREMLPQSNWPADIASFPPIAFVLTGFVPIYPDKATRPQGEEAITFDRMYAQAQVLVGARAGENISMFAGVNFATNSAVELSRGFIVFSNIIDGLLHARIGQFEPQIFSFSSYRRIAGPTYWITSDPLSPASFALEPFVRGVNLSGTAAGRIGYDVAWVQGVEAPNYGGEKVRQVPRDGYAHLFTRIGGMRLDAADGAGGGSRDDTSIDVGGFVYLGEHDVDADNAATTPPEGDFVSKAGGDVRARLGRLELLVAIAHERHHFDMASDVERTQGLGEVTARVFPWMFGALRAESDAATAAHRRRLVPMLAMHPRLNLKFQVFAIFEEDTNGAVSTGTRVREIDIGGTYAF
jgi:hypothetical protein